MLSSSNILCPLPSFIVSEFCGRLSGNILTTGIHIARECLQIGMARHWHAKGAKTAMGMFSDGLEPQKTGVPVLGEAMRCSSFGLSNLQRGLCVDPHLLRACSEVFRVPQMNPVPGLGWL